MISLAIVRADDRSDWHRVKTVGHGGCVQAQRKERREPGGKLEVQADNQSIAGWGIATDVAAQKIDSPVGARNQDLQPSPSTMSW